MDGLQLAPREPDAYEPVRSKTCIRVLHRLGTTEAGLLRFGFKVLDLAFDFQDRRHVCGLEPSPDRPRYHCLSYTWGNPFLDGDLFLDTFVAAGEDYSDRHLLPIICDGKTLQVR